MANTGQNKPQQAIFRSMALQSADVHTVHLNRLQ
jgi:hypothetical protein